MGTWLDQFIVPSFGPVTTLKEARSHDIHEDRDNGEWCAIYASLSWTLELIDVAFCAERHCATDNIVNDDLQSPPTQGSHQEGV